LWALSIWPLHQRVGEGCAQTLSSTVDTRLPIITDELASKVSQGRIEKCTRQITVLLTYVFFFSQKSLLWHRGVAIAIIELPVSNRTLIVRFQLSGFVAFFLKALFLRTGGHLGLGVS